MSKNMKNHPNISRVTILIDDDIFSAVKQMAADSRGKGNFKTYQIVNKILAKAVGKPYPEHLKHRTIKDEE